MKTKTESHTIRLVLLPAIVVVLLLSACGNDSNGNRDPTNAAATVALATAVEKTLTDSVTAYGTVQADPAQVVHITMPLGGRVTAVFVRAGQAVAAGDAVIGIETSPSDTAQYTQAVAAVDYAESAYRQTKALFNEHLATRDQLAQAQKERTAAKSELNRLKQSGAGQARQNLIAPRNGVVTAVTATAGDRLQIDTPVATIGAGDGLQVALGVEVATATRIQTGDEVSLSAPLNPDVKLVTRISAVNRMVDPVRDLVEVIAPLPAVAHEQLMVGMMLSGQIAVESWKGVVIPRTALMEDDDGLYVFTVSNGTAHRSPVTVAIAGASEIGIQTGIAVDQRVVIEGNAALEDGTAVREATP